jgi:hypothetical protein
MCPNHPSCGSWSATHSCGDPFCGLTNGACKSTDFIGLRQPKEKYRVCFNYLGESCTEYQSAGSSMIPDTCGC